MIPENLKYSKDHEWVKIEDNKGIIGITEHAQKALGDVVFVELPEVEDEFEQGESFGVVESVKAVSDCYAPMSGVITAINEKLLDTPELINQDPYGEGWMLVIEFAGDLPDDLMSADGYEKFLLESEEE